MRAAEKFHTDSQLAASDKELHRKLKHSIAQYTRKAENGKKQFTNLDLAKSRAAAIRRKVIDNLDKYLIEFESNFIKNGGKLIWAQDAEEALLEIGKILEKSDVRTVVKSKSMVSEEIGLNEFLEQKNISCHETDLGEFIQQEAGEKPFHIVTPAMHKSKADVAALYHKKFGLAESSTPEAITTYTRSYLQNKFSQAAIGITGANFLVADCGAIAVTENEGNAVLAMSLPKIHIAIAGIEKIIPSLSDLDLFWPLLATHGTGQNVTTYNSIIRGPKQENEKDGPAEMYLLLLDNGRSELLKQVEQRRALSCIRCGACLNVCPVYTTIGGHAYGNVYSGPIGKVIAPNMDTREKYAHLSDASSLCGKCTDVCPVKIDLHNLLLQNRKTAYDMGMQGKAEKMAWYFWKNAMLSRKKMNKGGAKVKNLLLRSFFKKAWGSQREMPAVAEKSFNQLMREKMGMN